MLPLDSSTRRIHCATFALATAIALLPPSAQALQRAFVASYGSDANTAANCVLGSPCRSFAAAMTVVDAGGEIVALDAAGYAAVTINKSVTITSNPGFYAGVAAMTGTAVVINGSGVNVTLRGLSINGIGAGDGIWMQVGAKLTIENCVVSNFSNSGISVTTPAQVSIVDTVIRDNSTVGAYFSNAAVATLANVRLLGNPNYGMLVASAPGTTRVSFTDGVISGSAGGARAESFANGESARLAITRTTISNNAVGIASIGSLGFASAVATNTTVTGSGTTALLQSGATSTLHSLGNNALTHNVADTTGTISSLPLQ